MSLPQANQAQLDRMVQLLARCDTNTHGIFELPTEDGTDDFGQSYTAQDLLIRLPDGRAACIAKTEDTDTFANGDIADTAGTDSYGMMYGVGDRLVQFPDGTFAALTQTIDTNTFSDAQPADAAGTDFFGRTYAVGDPILVLANGKIVSQVDTVFTDTDTYTDAQTAAADGNDVFGRPYVAGDPVLILNDGRIVCAAKMQDTFTDAMPATAAGSDMFNQPYMVGDPVLILNDGRIVAQTRTVDTLSDPTTATAAGTDSFGNDYAIGDTLIQWPDGRELCIRKVVDTFATAEEATAVDTDQNGDPIAIGDEVIDVPGYGRICIPKKVVLSDIKGNALDVNSETFLTDRILQTASIVFDIRWPGFSNPDALPGDADFCLPANPPYCPNDYNYRTSFAGLTFERPAGGTWTLTSVSAQSGKTDCATGSPVTVWNAGQGGDFDLQDFTTAGVIQSVQDSLENTFCFDIMVEWTLRWGVAGQAREGNRWLMTEQAGADHAPALTDLCAEGVIGRTVDTRANNVGVQNFSTLGLHSRWLGKLRPGDTSLVHREMSLRVVDHNPQNANTIQAQNFTLDAKWWPCPVGIG